MNETLQGDSGFKVIDTSNDIILLIILVTHKILDKFRNKGMEKKWKAENNDNGDKNEEDLRWEKIISPWILKLFEMLHKSLADEDTLLLPSKFNCHLACKNYLLTRHVIKKRSVCKIILLLFFNYLSNDLGRYYHQFP